MKKLLLLGLVMLFCAGCTANILGRPKPDITRVYLLQGPNTEPKLENLQRSQHPFFPKSVIGVYTVKIPEYLESQHIIYKMNQCADGSRIFQHAFMRWGEPVEDGFGRIICRELAAAFPEDWVVVAPWAVDIIPNFTLRIAIEDWIATLDQGVLFTFRCEFRKSNDDTFLCVKSYSHFIPLDRNSLEESIVPLMYDMAIKSARELAADMRYLYPD
jgi:uncharacterized lipoprotein YmbA